MDRAERRATKAAVEGRAERKVRQSDDDGRAGDKTSARAAQENRVHTKSNAAAGISHARGKVFYNKCNINNDGDAEETR